MKIINYCVLCLTFACISMGNSIAQTIEQIHMKSGSIVEGYISEQKPGKYISVKTTKATIVVNSDTLISRVNEFVPLHSLSEEWRDWAVENNKYTELGGSPQLELSTLKFKNSTISNVFILEKGAMIKFIDVTPNEYRFKWGDMYCITKNKRPSNLFSGLKEILVFHDNTKVEGQIIEQFPGMNLKIVTSDDEVLSFKFSQIKQISTEKLSEQLDLWSQIPLLDKIQLKGDNSTYVGFISSRILGTEIVFESKDGAKRVFPQSRIVSYAKIPNDEYITVYDKLLNDGDVLLNDNKAYFVSLKMQDPYLLLGDVVSAQFSVGDTIKIDARLESTATPISVVKAHIETLPVIGEKKMSYEWPVITYQDLFQSSIPVKREVSPLGNIKIEFVLQESGDYVVHIQNRNEFIVINVIDKEANQ